ncbi:MAG: glycosyltransferase family 4 protein [Desulfuromonadales bacterium]|nr:glycosyltransferase family 4 protein [Desulfuromonadales bacterium]
MKIGITSAFFRNYRAGTWVYTNSLLQAFDGLADSSNRFHTIDFLDQPVAGLRTIEHTVYPLPTDMLVKIVWPNLVLPRRAARDSFDIIHATTHYGTFIPCCYKNVITVTDVSPLLHPETHGRGQVMYHRHILPQVLKRADAIVTISHSSKKDIVSCCRVAEEKVHVIHLGVDGRFVPNAAGENAFARTLPERYILNIGTLEARKNLPRLLEAYAIARGKGLPHKLLIGGARGWQLSDLAGIVEKYKLENDVVFLGFVEDADLPALYSGAEFFVYPSIYEGFGMPILEAMACGTPVITSNCSSMPEVAGDAALLVDPLDVNDLAARMLELAGSGELRRSLREKGVERTALFSWEKTARETLAVYEAVMSDE